MEFTNEMKSVLAHFAIGAIFGYVSFILGNRNYALILGAAMAYGLSHLSQKLFKPEEKKWWLGNGLWPYLTAWIASWTIFLNM